MKKHIQRIPTFMCIPYINYPKNVTWTIGGSADFFEGDCGIDDRDNQFNPKFGVNWNPFPGTTLRAAAIQDFEKTYCSQTRRLSRLRWQASINFLTMVKRQTPGDMASLLIRNFLQNFMAGAEFSKRDLSAKGINFETFEIVESDLDERLGRAYLYWTPHPWLAINAEYQFERFEAPKEFMTFNTSRARYS